MYDEGYSAKNILFASEMVGAVRGVDPTTGHNYDDTKRYIDATPNLNQEQKAQVFGDNTCGFSSPETLKRQMASFDDVYLELNKYSWIFTWVDKLSVIT